MQGFECNFLLFIKISNILDEISVTMAEKKKQERVVVHLEVDGKHYYYGNLKALCDNWGKDKIGVSHAYLKNLNISEEKPFINKKCIIRRGIIVTSEKKCIFEK